MTSEGSSAARGVILVAFTKNIHDENCRWHEAGVYFARQFWDYDMEGDMIVRR